MEICPASPEQAGAIEALHERCFPADPWPEGLAGRWISRLLTAAEDGRLLGYALLMFVLDEGELFSIAVAPEDRRRGVADALMDALEARARALGLASVTLEVRASNAPAIALYEKHGFTVVGRRKDYYEKPREDAILMTLVI